MLYGQSYESISTSKISSIHEADHLSGSFKVLAKLSYLLVFGKDAYTANDAMQGSAGTAAESSIEVKMGRDALTKKCTYPKVFDLCSCFVK